MITEKERQEGLRHVEAFKLRPDYIDLYLYFIYKDKCFLTSDLINAQGKPKQVAIKKKAEELIILMGRHIITSELGIDGD